jgi:hypothetical protein
MKNVISALVLSLMAAQAFAQGLPVSASAVADEDVSARTAAVDPKDNQRPAPSVGASVATLDCCTVSSPVSMAYDGRVSTPQADEGSDSIAMAGLGFGLFGLVGVTKFARRKKQKGTETL